MKQRYSHKIMCCLLLADDKLRLFVGNARVVTGVEFQQIPVMQWNILPLLYFESSYSARLGFSGISIKSKSRYCCECTLYCKETVLHYQPIANKLTWFIGNTRTVWEVDFQENSSKGSRDISVLLLFFPRKGSFIFG